MWPSQLRDSDSGLKAAAPSSTSSMRLDLSRPCLIDNVCHCQLAIVKLAMVSLPRSQAANCIRL